MSQYNSTPISQLVPGTTVLGTNVYPATDITDLTQSSSGSTKKYTVSQLQQYLVNTPYAGSNLSTVYVSTTANLDGLYDNGPSLNGIGATLTNNGTLAAFTADGITGFVGMEVLVNFQTDERQNGIYTVTTVGDGSSIKWVLTRSSNADNSTVQLQQGDFVGVLFGATYYRTFWFLTSATPITFGTSVLTFDNAAGGESSFIFQNVQFVAKGGSDSNVGTILNAPKLTIQAAIDASAAGGLVWVFDNGQYAENLTITKALQLYAPFAELDATSGDLITVSGGPTTVVVLTIGDVNQGTGALALNILDTGTTVFFAAPIFLGNIDVHGNLIINDIAQIASTIHVYPTGMLLAQLTDTIGCTFIFDAGSTIAGNFQSVVSPGNVLNTVYGSQEFINNATINGTLIASGLSYPVADAANGYIMTTNGAGALSLQPNTGTTYLYQQAYWVSQANGNDANTGESINSPFATIQHAVASAGLTPTVIYVVDANINNLETIFTSGLGQVLHISAPGTYFAGTITNAANDNMYLDAPQIAGITNSGNGRFNAIQIIGATCTGASSSTYFVTDIMNGLAMTSSCVVSMSCTINASFITNDGTCYLNGILGNTVPGFVGNQRMSGNLSFSPTTGGIVGTTVADVAAAGIVGQVISSVILSGSAVNCAATGVAKDLTFIDLPAGDWEVEGNIFFNTGSVTGNCTASCWISLTSATIPNDAYRTNGLGIGGFNNISNGAVLFEVNVATTTRVYLSGFAGYSSGLPTMCGGIYARRAR